MREQTSRRVGLAMKLAAIVGITATTIGTIAAWYLAGRLEATVDETLDVTQISLETLDQTITVADDVISNTEGALVAAAETLEGLVVTVDASSGVVADIESVMGELAPALRSTVIAIRDTAEAADGVDGVLRALDSVPFAPSYDPDEPFGTTLRTLSDDLAPLADALGSSAENLADFRRDADATRVDLMDFAAQVRELSTSVGASDLLLDRYRSTTEYARALTEQTDRSLSRDANFSRALIVLVGLAVAVAQVVPYWIGRELMSLVPPTSATSAPQG